MRWQKMNGAFFPVRSSTRSITSLGLTSSNQSLNTSDILKEGFLTKQAENRRIWRTRYFISFQDGKLLGYDSGKPANLGIFNNRFSVTQCHFIKLDASKHIDTNAFDICAGPEPEKFFVL